MKIKSKLLTGSVLFVIISAILALLFTNSYISVKSTSNYINSIGAEVTAGEVYINKTGDTDKISTIADQENSYSWLDISIPDDERPEGRGNNDSHFIIKNSAQLRWLSHRIGFGGKGSNDNIYVDLAADIDMSTVTTKAVVNTAALSHNGYFNTDGVHDSLNAEYLACTDFIDVEVGDQIDASVYSYYQKSSSAYYYTVLPFSGGVLQQDKIKAFSLKYNNNGSTQSTWFTVPEGIDQIKLQIGNTGSINIDIDENTKLTYTTYNPDSTQENTYNMHSWLPIGNGSKPFSGYFDGKNHTISNLTISTEVLNSDINNYVGFGLFGTVKAGEFRNLNIINSAIESLNKTTDVHVGLFAGQSTAGSGFYDITVGSQGAAGEEFSYVVGNFTSNSRVGGVIGYGKGYFAERLTNYALIKSDSVFTGGVSGEFEGLTQYETNKINGLKNYGLVTKNSGNPNNGGVIGYALNVEISDCINYGSVVGYTAGGVIGRISSGTVSRCINYGDYVEGVVGIGGVLGRIHTGQSVTVSECLNYGLIRTASSVTELSSRSTVGIGGIVGIIDQESSATRYKTISNCKNYGEVKDEYNTNTIRMGGVVGQASSADVKECENNGYIHSSNAAEVGGVIGYAARTGITRCFNNGEVSGYNLVGGIFGNFGGSSFDTTISDCYNEGDITATGASGSGEGYASAVAGGIAGRYDAAGKTNSTFLRCVNIGSVSGNNAGGIVGNAWRLNENNIDNYTLMQDCYNKGAVNGGNYAGGIFGTIFSSSYHKAGTILIKNVYNSGTITLNYGTNKGTLAGNVALQAADEPLLEVNNFYAYSEDGTTQNNVGASSSAITVTNSNVNISGTVDESDFAGFDFGADETWGLVSTYNNGLPYLRAIDEINLTFNYNRSGIASETIVILYGDGNYTVNSEDYNEKANYRYLVDYWTLSSDGSGTQYGVGDKIPIERLRDIEIFANYVAAQYKIKIDGITSTISGALNETSTGTEVSKEETSETSKTYQGTFTIDSSSAYSLVASGSSTESGTTYNFAGWNVLTSDGTYSPVAYGNGNTTISLSEVFNNMIEGWDTDGVITLVPKTGSIIYLDFKIEGEEHGAIQVNGSTMEFGGRESAYAGINYIINSTLQNYYEVEKYTISYPEVTGHDAKVEEKATRSFELNLISAYEGSAITITVKYRPMDISFNLYAVDSNLASIGNASDYASLISGTVAINGMFSDDINIYESERYRFSEMIIVNRRTSENLVYSADELNMSTVEDNPQYVFDNGLITFDETNLYNYAYNNEIVIYLVYEQYYLINFSVNSGGYAFLYVDNGSGYIEVSLIGINIAEEDEPVNILYEDSVYVKGNSSIKIEAFSYDAYEFSNYDVIQGPLYTVIGSQMNLVASEDVEIDIVFAFETYTLRYLAKTDTGSNISSIDGGFYVNGELGNVVKLGDIVTFVLPEATKYKFTGLKITLRNGAETDIDYNTLKSFEVTNEFINSYFDSKSVSTVTATFIRQRLFSISTDSQAGSYESINCYVVNGGVETPFEAVLGTTYNFDSNTVIKIVATPAKYYEFTGFKGQITSSELTENDNIVNIKLNADRVILASFKATEFNIEVVDGSGKVDGDFSANSKTAVIGDKIILTFSPKTGYAIGDWTVNGIDVMSSDLQENIVFSGNTVTITLDKNWLDTFTDNTITSVVKTTLSPLILGIVIGGSLGVVILVAVLIVLMILSQKQNKKIKEELLEENKEKMKFVSESNIVSRLRAGENVTQISDEDIKAAKKAKKAAKKAAKKDE